MMIYTNWYRDQGQSENKEKRDRFNMQETGFKQFLEALYLIQRRIIPEEEGFKAINLSGTFHKH